MRVLILNQFYVPDISPTAHLAASLAEDRASRGDEVTVLASHGGYIEADTKSHSTASGSLHVERLWTPQFGKQSHFRRLFDYASYYALAMLRALTLPRQDVIVSLTTPPFIALAGVLHKAAHPSARLILWNMDCYPDVIERYGLISSGGFLSFMLRRFNRLIFERVDHLVGLDSAMIDLLVSQYASRTLKHSVIPNWEDEALYPAGVAASASRGSSGKFNILYLGNTGYGHNFDTVLDAAEALKNDPVQFDFYGGGVRWVELQNAKTSRALANISLHTYVPKEATPALMSEAHCALITLRDDALGIMSPSKLHAKLAMGLPIIYIGPRHSNVDDAIQKYGCGASFRHGQYAEFAAFVRHISTDRAAYDDLRARARIAFESAYCASRTLPQFDSVLRG